jgi:hypothetical protein
MITAPSSATKTMKTTGMSKSQQYISPKNVG